MPPRNFEVFFLSSFKYKISLCFHFPKNFPVLQLFQFLVFTASVCRNTFHMSESWWKIISDNSKSLLLFRFIRKQKDIHKTQSIIQIQQAAPIRFRTGLFGNVRRTALKNYLTAIVDVYKNQIKPKMKHCSYICARTITLQFRALIGVRIYSFRWWIIFNSTTYFS